MEMSESIMKLSKAVVKMQGELQGAIKSSDNPFFKSKYADLEYCWAAGKQPLQNNGLAVLQFVGEYEDGIQKLKTILVHESGEWISNLASIPLGKKDPHGAIAAVTYLRRASFSACLGLIQQDLDWNDCLDPKTVTKHGKGSHSPIQGSLKELYSSELDKANSTAINITASHKLGMVEDARKMFYESGLSNEVQMGVWELLQSNSKCRSAIKALQDTKNAQS